MELLALQVASQDTLTTVMLALIEAAKLVALAYIGYKVRYGVAPPGDRRSTSGSRKRKKRRKTRAL